MGGKSGGSQTLGYWYHVGYHHLISATEFDAFLEFRGGDKTAWSGEIDASGTITINAPNLWGGEKDQGGIVGDADIMFGEATQGQNAYLVSAFGSQVPNWRGVGGVVFKGGKFGAMNPYPQKPSYKIRRITKGWDNDTCWYSAKAAIDVAASALLPADATGWDYQVLAEESNPGYENLTVPTSGWSTDGQAPFGSGPSLPSPANTDWPGHTVLWIKRSITVSGSGAQSLKITAENGCVVFINGAIVGASNRANDDIAYNDSNPVTVPLSAGQTYEIAVKAFDEIPVHSGNRTYLTIEISAPGLTAMNPAHMLYDALTAQDMLAEPTANIDDTSFQAGADWFYSQGFGLCTAYDPDSETPEDFRKRIETVAGCSCNRSPIDGKWYLDIANGVYTLADLPILTDDDILEFDDAPTSVDAAVNSLGIEYNDVQQKVTVTTPPTQALALVRANGLNHDVHKYHEIPTSALAARVAVRDLQALVTPTKTFSLTTTRKPYSWRRNSYFRLQVPKRGISDMVCLLAEKSSGTLKSGAMTITATEDIYSLPSAGFTDVEAGVDTSSPQTPLAIMQQAAFEAPYIEIVRSLSRADLAALPDDVGYAMAIAKDPSNSRDFTMTVSEDGGTTYAAKSNGSFAPYCIINEADDLKSGLLTDFTISAGNKLDQVTVGAAGMWDEEIVRVDAIDTGAGTITMGRGCADTAPQIHAAGAYLFFYQLGSASDQTEYTDGETIKIELLTNTGTAQLDPSLASPLAITFAQRQFAPYPPALVYINGGWYPGAVASTAISVSWVDRNRVTQGDQLIDTTATSVAKESGTTYTCETLAASDMSVIDSSSGLDAGPYSYAPGSDGDYLIRLYSVRDGVQSNPHVIPVAYSGATFDPSANYASSENGIWLDPSDLSTMFQDSAATVPVTAVGQSVARINDKSGNGNYLLATSPGVLQQDANGNYVIRFASASSQFMYRASSNSLFLGTDSLMFTAGVRFADGAASRCLFARSKSTALIGRYWFGRIASGSLATNYSYDNVGGIAVAGSADSATTIRVISGTIDRPSGSIGERVNAAAFGTPGAFTPDDSTNETQTLRFLLGAYNDSTDTGQINYFNGDFYGLILRLAPTIDTTLQTNNENWMNSKCQAY